MYLILNDLFLSFEYAPWAAAGIIPLITPALITLGFAIVAWRIHGVTRSGAIAGALITYAIYSTAGFGAFAAVVSVFLLAWGATKIGYEHKQRLGTAERREG